MNIQNVSSWFDTIGIPFPTLSVYIVASIEALGVILLVLGLLTRLVSIPLIIIMFVAIITVHYTNGFGAGDNGFEIPLYYMIFLIIFLSYGAGKFSLDNLLFSKKD